MIIAAMFIWLLIQPVPTYAEPAPIASPRIKAAMKYHGIRFAEGRADGTFWFERNGKWCRLFTEGFEKSWERRQK